MIPDFGSRSTNPRLPGVRNRMDRILIQGTSVRRRERARTLIIACRSGNEIPAGHSEKESRMRQVMGRWLAGVMLALVTLSVQADAPLTDERLDNLLGAMDELQPVMEQVSQRLASLPEDERPPRLDPRAEDFDPEAMAESMTEALEKVDADSDVRRVAEKNGFDSVEELLEVQARVMMGFLAQTQEAMMNNPNVPEQARQKMKQQFGNIADKVSDNDREVLERNKQKIMDFMQAQARKQQNMQQQQPTN